MTRDAQLVVVALAREVQHRRAGLAEGLDRELVQRARAGERAGDEQHRARRREPELRAAPRRVAAAASVAGIGRPTTTYFGGRRAAIGYARKTRLANGAASRLARPRCASASVIAAGIRCAPRREHHRPGDVAAAAEHDVRLAPLEDPVAGGRRRERAQRRSEPARRPAGAAGR